jgi:TatA/E family protein of Tat protein translocase
MFGSIGFPEIILIFVVVLLLFGPKKLPDFAKTFGKAIREFRKTINEAKSTIEEEIEKADLNVVKDLKEIDRDIKDMDNEIKHLSTLDDHDHEQKNGKSRQ